MKDECGLTGALLDISHIRILLGIVKDVKKDVTNAITSYTTVMSTFLYHDVTAHIVTLQQIGRYMIS